ncbi:MAG: ATP-binding protein [Candidatus Zixiibacteriota bacterium]
MKLSVFRRHYIITAVIITTIAIFFSIISVSSNTKIIEDSTYQDLKHTSQLIKYALSDSFSNQELMELFNKIEKETNIELDIFTNDTLLRKQENCFSIESKPAEEVQTAIEDSTGRNIRQVSGSYRMFFAEKMDRKNSPFDYILRSSIEMDDINYFKFLIITRIITISVIFLIGFIALSYLLSRSLQKRVNRINRRIKTISTGNKDKIHSKDEFITLEESIDEMSNSYIELYKTLNTEKSNLLQIINSLEDGILVLDENNSILLLNKASEKLLRVNRKDAISKKALGIIRIPEIRYLIESDKPDSRDYSEGDKFINARSIEIEAISQRVVLLRNITEQFKTQRSQSDFVSNVSHELRTPITIIKGFAETMLMNDLGKDPNRYVKTIIRHTNRLISLVEDIMTLSKVEHEQHLKFEPINLCAIVEEINHLYHSKAEKKGIMIFNTCMPDMPNVKGDRNLVEIVISNLVDNAIKYNKDNGRISIKSDYDEHYVTFSIEDSGIGISEEDQKRIFERFYTADKARSHKVGGTGLGLSIVKKIVLLHDGKIELESKFGIGSKFTIKLHIFN